MRGIESAAEHGGKACEAKVAREVEKCNTRSCDPGCVDGEWAAWGDWSTCTATCGTGDTSGNLAGSALSMFGGRFRVRLLGDTCAPLDFTPKPWSQKLFCAAVAGP